MPDKPFETITVNMMEVACDGGGGPLGHPKVFLHLDPVSKEVICPYCSRQYVFKAVGKKAS
jgi:uncharacterized Zn-finger protein